MEPDGPGSAPVLVLGATGGQGGAVAAALIRAGRSVRALVRDPQSASARKLGAAGAQLVAGDFTDRTALAVAMRGAAAAFALTTPFESGPAAELAQGNAIIEAAVAVGLPYLVFSSVAGATAHTGVPHFESKARVEQALAASGLTHTVAAPTYFYDNALGGRQDLLSGLLELPLPADHRLQQLDRSDLGAFVAILLSDPAACAGSRFELASDAPTPVQMRDALSEALGRPVEFRETPLADVQRRSSDMAAMWEFLRGPGYQADIAALRRDFPAVGWTSFTAWAQRTVPRVSSG
ncbi:MAG TPA: NmrA family NAD(P)-binding protein [Streptosporangiaceae bacterium]|nr:NmrA family NAD(P)-binding protein [Streptosporangiaceae bacterium]